MAGFRYFDIKVDKTNVTEDIGPVLDALRPGWSRDVVRHEDFTVSHVNSMTCFYHTSDKRRSDALLVRVYGLEGNSIVNRHRELLSVQISHAAGCFPPILATFQNGFVYKCAPGRMMNYHDLTTPKVIREVSRKLYRLHHIDVASIDLYDREGNATTYTEKPKTIEQFITLVKTIPEKPNKEELVELFRKCRSRITYEYLTQEYEYIKGFLDQVHLPISIVHGDFQPRNMVIDEESGCITFIDYDMSGVSYEIADFTLLFKSKPSYDKLGFTSPDDPDITEEVRRLYLQEYVRCSGNHGRLSEDQVTIHCEILYLHSRIVQIVDQFIFLVTGLAHVDLPLKRGLSLINYVIGRIDKYNVDKRDLPRLCSKCRELTAKIAA